MTSFVFSVNTISIRLTDERWEHIANEHGELSTLQLEVLETVARPEKVLQGGAGELLAIREIRPRTWLVAVYREIADDGFIITAFLTTRGGFLARRRQLWP